jgi:hypothetical protein
MVWVDRSGSERGAGSFDDWRMLIEPWVTGQCVSQRPFEPPLRLAIVSPTTTPARRSAEIDSITFDAQVRPRTIPTVVGYGCAKASETVKDVRLNGFFYGSSKTQCDLADAAGDRLVFVFVILTDTNRYGKPFFAVVPFPELERRTRTKRIQYQVNLRTDMADQGTIQGPFPLT